MTTRVLRVEACEERNLMAVDLFGTKFEDATGDGITPDDGPLAGVTINLYSDDGDGMFDPNVDGIADSQITNLIGAYTFAAVPDGKYFIAEEVPAGMVQTGGPPFYVVDIIGGVAFAGTHSVIDNFDLPDPGTSFIINLTDPDPTLVKNNVAGVVGGQRDALIDVLGVAGATSIFGQIGFGAQGGVFNFGSSFPGVQATLQYDGNDADLIGPPASLVNNLGLSTDLTDGGANTGFRIDFNTLQIPGAGTLMDVQIRLTSPGGTATFSGNAAENMTPQAFFAPFGNFNTVGAFSFASVTSIEVVFNSLGVADIDFLVDQIVTDTPQNRGFDFANFTPVVTPAPAIAIDKVTIDPPAAGSDGPVILTGEPITWQYTVTNPGNVPLSNILVSDSQGVVPVYQSGDDGDNILQVGETWIYTAAGVAITGNYSNTGIVTGIYVTTVGQPTQVTDSDDSSYVGVDPQIAIDKITIDGINTGDGITVLAGDAISWQYSVTNAGTVPLSNVSVTDNQPGVTPVYQSGDDGDNVLEVGETWIYTASGTAILGNYSNIGTASGSFTDDAGHTSTPSATDPSSYLGVTPQIAIVKVTIDGGASGDGLTILTGESISWQYSVTNPGTVPLSNVTVTDNQPGVTPVYQSGDDGDNLLEVGETWIYSANGTAVTGNYSNIGTATGSFTDDAGHTSTPSATDPSNYIGIDPQIAINKITIGNGNSGDGINVFAGDAITWQYSVTNAGTVPLSNVVVTDNQGGVTPVYQSGDDGDNLLEVGETWIYTAGGIAIAGAYNNIGTATGSFTDTAGHTRTPTDTDPSSYFGEQPISTISGFVYVDVNNDGFFAPQETPLQNVIVTLMSTDNLPLVTAQTVTDVNGFYIFTGLRAGTYKIVETQPVLFLDGKDTIGTPGGTTTNDMFSNIVLPAGYDGEDNNFGEVGLVQPSKQYLIYPAIQPVNRFDINTDGLVNAMDVLLVVNTINASASPSQTAHAYAQSSLDVNQDGRVNALDVVQLVNHMNTTTASASPSSTASAHSSAPVTASAHSSEFSDIAAGLAANQSSSTSTTASGASSADTVAVAGSSSSSTPASSQSTTQVAADSLLLQESVWGNDPLVSDDLFNLL